MDDNEKFHIFNIAKRNVSLVIVPIDGFLGMAVTKDIKITIEGININPEIKNTGYFVFANVRKGEYLVNIKSKYFFDISFNVTINENDYLIKKIVLIPKRNYPLPENTPFLYSNTLVNTNYYVLNTAESTGIRLIDSYIKNNKYHIKVATNYNINMENKNFAINNGEDIENFFVEEKVEENTYIISEPLNKIYEKRQAISPLSIGRSDDTGYLLMALWGIYDLPCDILIYRNINEEIEYIKKIMVNSNRTKVDI